MQNSAESPEEQSDASREVWAGQVQTLTERRGRRPRRRWAGRAPGVERRDPVRWGSARASPSRMRWSACSGRPACWCGHRPRCPGCSHRGGPRWARWSWRAASTAERIHPERETERKMERKGKERKRKREISLAGGWSRLRTRDGERDREWDVFVQNNTKIGRNRNDKNYILHWEEVDI